MPHKKLAARIGISQLPEKPTKIAVLEACTLLNALTSQQREMLAKGSFMAYADRGEVIWLADAPSEFVAIVGAGFVKMTKCSAQGQEIALELLGPGQCFGLFAVLEGRAYPLSAIAVTNTWYLKIPKEVFASVYQKNLEIKDLIIRTIGPRLRKAHDMMSRLVSGRVEERVAAVLLILADNYGEKQESKIQLNVPLTRQDISEMAGTTVETTIRVMSKWQKKGILETDHQIITILNERELAKALRGND